MLKSVGIKYLRPPVWAHSCMKGHTRLHGVIHHMQHDPAGVEGSSLLSRGSRLWPPFYIFFSIPQTFTGAMTEKKKLKGFMFLLRQNYFIQEFFGEIHHNKTKSWTCYSQSGYPHRFPLLPLLIDETVMQWDTLIYNSISHSIGWRCEFSADLGIHHCLTKSHQIMTLECQKLPKK